MKINRLLPTGIVLLALMASATLLAQQPGGLPAKFSAEIKRDVGKFVQGQGDAASRRVHQAGLRRPVVLEGLDFQVRTPREPQEVEQQVSLSTPH